MLFKLTFWVSTVTSGGGVVSRQEQESLGAVRSKGGPSTSQLKSVKKQLSGSPPLSLILYALYPYCIWIRFIVNMTHKLGDFSSCFEAAKARVFHFQFILSGYQEIQVFFLEFS